MSEKHETIADILDEMTRFRNGPNAKRNVSGAFVGGVLFGLANRIRAAMKREVDELQQQYDECVRDYNDAQRARSVANSEIAELKKQIGNAAKLREAVVLALSLLDLKEGVPYKTVSQKDIDFMKAALAAPPRNCDRVMCLEDALAGWREVSPEESGPFDNWLFAEAKGDAK